MLGHCLEATHTPDEKGKFYFVQNHFRTLYVNKFNVHVIIPLLSLNYYDFR